MQDIRRCKTSKAFPGETWFSWMGAASDDGPFYYRVRSPVVMPRGHAPWSCPVVMPRGHALWS